MDTLLHYYQHDGSEEEQQLLTAFKAGLPMAYPFSPYIASADISLLETLSKDTPQGITISAPGFYAPQGREVRARLAAPELTGAIQQFSFGGQRITNLEMETAGIYGMASVLCHKAISFNVILANRVTQTFSTQPQQIMDTFIQVILERLTTLK